MELMAQLSDIALLNRERLLLFVNNLLTLRKSNPVAFYGLLNLLKFTLEHVIFIRDFVNSVLYADVALLGSDYGAELLVRVLSYLSGKVLYIESGELFKGLDRGITLTAEGVSDNLVKVKFEGLGNVEKCIINVGSAGVVMLVIIMPIEVGAIVIVFEVRYVVEGVLVEYRVVKCAGGSKREISERGARLG